MATINATLATKGLMLKIGTVVDATLIGAVEVIFGLLCWTVLR